MATAWICPRNPHDERHRDRRIEEGVLVEESVVSIHLSVVGRDDHHGLVPFATLLHRRDQPADLIIDQRHRTRVVRTNRPDAIRPQSMCRTRATVERSRPGVGAASGPGERIGRVRGVEARMVRLRCVPGFVGTAEADHAEPRRVTWQLLDVLAGSSRDPRVVVEVQWQRRRPDDERIVGEALCEVTAERVGHACILPCRDQMTGRSQTTARPHSLVDDVEAERRDGSFLLAKIPRSPQMELAEDAGRVSGSLQLGHPRGGALGHLHRPVGPQPVIVGVLPECQ